MKDYTKTIEAVLYEMEDIGLVDDIYTSKFNMINEMRCWMGEEKFYKFLEQMVWDWEFEPLYHHFDDKEYIARVKSMHKNNSK